MAGLKQGWMDAWMDGRVHGWMGGLTDAWMDGQIHCKGKYKLEYVGEGFSGRGTTVFRPGDQRSNNSIWKDGLPLQRLLSSLLLLLLSLLLPFVVVTLHSRCGASCPMRMCMSAFPPHPACTCGPGSASDTTRASRSMRRPRRQAM
eukprot:354365-Chlamydomonas_euryale.AAC.4